MDKASVSSMLFLFLLGTIEKSIAIHDGVISTEATTVQTVDKTNKSLRGDLLPIAKSKSKSQRNHYQRVLQSLNLYERPFVLAGVPLYANIALEQCVDEWMPFVACVTTDCPNVTERCSPNIFYDHGASNYGSNTPKIMDAATEHLNCTTVETNYCAEYATDDCCMTACQDELFSLMTCMVQQVNSNENQEELSCSTVFSCEEQATEGLTTITNVQEKKDDENKSVDYSDQLLQEIACFTEDDRFHCIYSTIMKEPILGTNITTVDARVNCLFDEEIGMDVHKAEDCQCETTILRHQRHSRQSCECSVCPVGSSSIQQPISIDCRNNEHDPFITDDHCSSLSCAAECTADLKPLHTFVSELVASHRSIASSNNFDVFFPSNLVPAADKLFFEGFTGATGRELWVTDGTTTGTRLVKDINPGTGSSLDDRNGFLYMSAELNSKLLFFADDNVHGKELWVSDGTGVGTTLVKDIVEGSEGVRIQFQNSGAFVKYEGAGHSEKLYFTVLEENGNGQEWQTDGTPEGTVPFKHDSIVLANLDVYSVHETSDVIYYTARIKDGNQSRFVFAMDRATDRIVRLIDAPLARNDHDVIEFHNKFYFSTGNLFATDGTVEGTKEVLKPNGESLLHPSTITVVKERLYFFTDCSLWSTDGSDFGMIELTDSSTLSCLMETTQFGNKVLFERGSPLQPWITDGTREGTFPLANATRLWETPFVVLNNDNLAFFVAASNIAGHDLYVTDGSRENTLIIPNIGGGGTNGSGMYHHIDNLAAVNDTVFFTVWYLFGPGEELWKIHVPPREYEIMAFASLRLQT